MSEPALNLDKEQCSMSGVLCRSLFYLALLQRTQQAPEHGATVLAPGGLQRQFLPLHMEVLGGCTAPGGQPTQALSMRPGAWGSAFLTHTGQAGSAGPGMVITLGKMFTSL